MSTVMKEATALENAVQRVAEAGRDVLDASDTSGMAYGYRVPHDEMTELREAVAEWKKATQDFLQALRSG